MGEPWPWRTQWPGTETSAQSPASYPSAAKESSSASAVCVRRKRQLPLRDRVRASEDAYQARGGSAPEPGETSST